MKSNTLLTFISAISACTVFGTEETAVERDRVESTNCVTINMGYQNDGINMTTHGKTIISLIRSAHIALQRSTNYRKHNMTLSVMNEDTTNIYDTFNNNTKIRHIDSSATSLGRSVMCLNETKTHTKFSRLDVSWLFYNETHQEQKFNALSYKLNGDAPSISDMVCTTEFQLTDIRDVDNSISMIHKWLLHSPEFLHLTRLLDNKKYQDCLKIQDRGADLFCSNVDSEEVAQINSKCIDITENLDIYIHNVNYIMKYCSILPAITAIISNIILIVIFARYDDMRTTANIYVVSLAIADIILVLQYLPSLMDILPNPYTIGVEGFALYIVSFTLATMSIDRFSSIRNATKLSSISTPAERKRNAILTIVGIWLLAGGLETAHMFLDARKNTSAGIVFYLSFINGTRFVIPILVITVMNLLTSRILRKGAKNLPGVRQAKHADARMKSALILLALVANFIVTYTVCYVNLSVQISYGVNKILLDEDLFLKLSVLERIGELMYLVNANLNPMILYFCSPVWKKYVRILFVCREEKTSPGATTTRAANETQQTFSDSALK